MCKVKIGETLLYAFPTTLYHYCSMDTLMSIVCNRTIRLSDATKSNDVDEVRAFYTRIYAISMSLLNEIEANRTTPYREISSYRKRLSSALNSDLSFLYYVFCMSTDPDVSNQWQIYADDGKGVAVGFNTACLRKLFVHTHFEIPWALDLSNTPSITAYKDPTEIVGSFESAKREDGIEYYLNEVIYSLDNAIREFEKTIQALRTKFFYRLSCDDVVDELLQDFHTAVDLTLRKYSANVKHVSFRNESEFRLGIMGANPISELYTTGDLERYQKELLEPTDVILSGFRRKPMGFRRNSSQIVGYIDIDFSDELACIIDEIRLGPECKSTKSDVKFFLEANGFPQGIRVKKSETPYKTKGN